MKIKQEQPFKIMSLSIKEISNKKNYPNRLMMFRAVILPCVLVGPPILDISHYL
jgi:hypothetical protein